jgi:hypothetical protein
VCGTDITPYLRMHCLIACGKLYGLTALGPLSSEMHLFYYHKASASMPDDETAMNDGMTSHADEKEASSYAHVGRWWAWQHDAVRHV